MFKAVIFDIGRTYKCAIDILTKYNTRIHSRIHEVSSTQIFMEILDAMDLPLKDFEQVKDCFYSFFRRDADEYDD